MAEPRGIRNNNPGNIKELSTDKTHWLGERATDDDPTFEEFESMEFGVRALAKILLTYYNKYNLCTVAGIIARWAPKSENDIEAYVGDVCGDMGVKPFTKLEMTNPGTVADLVRAIIKHENGYRDTFTKTHWVDEADLIRGVSAALK